MKPNDSIPLVDDPRLTAYALGELEPQESAEVEALLQNNPAAQATVAEIRALASQLEKALIDEPVALPTRPEVPVAQERAPKAKTYAYPSAKVVRFPYYWVAGAAAACFTVMIVLHRSAPREHPAATRIVELDLSDKGPTPDSPAEPAKTTEVANSDGTSALAPEATKPESPIDTPAASEAVPPAETHEPEKAVVAVSEPQNASEAFNSNLNTEPSLTGPLLETKPLVAQQERPAPTHLDEPAKNGGKSMVVASSDTPRNAPEDAKVTNSPSAKDEKVVLPAFMVSTGDGRKAGVIAASETRVVRSNAYPQDHDFMAVINHRLSAFTVDVETDSYVNVRRSIASGRLPSADSVHIEELVNYFPYRYSPPPTVENVTTRTEKSASARAKESAHSNDVTLPVSASMEVAAAPWNPAHRLVRIGLKAQEKSEVDHRPANLVFLVDVSGSMEAINKLPLVKDSLRRLVEKLKPSDRIAIVTYWNGARVALPSTKVGQKLQIQAALDSLKAGGSSNGDKGIQLAYEIAQDNFLSNGLNRVIVCTDGDFDMGMSSEGALVRLVQKKARSGVFLSALGFGMGDYHDSMLEKLADKGNGDYGYVDNESEAKKLLVDQLSERFATIAKDVKLQVEFNPAVASAYRLIGYENHPARKSASNSDEVDSAAIGSGQMVTALYEVIPAGEDKAVKAAPAVAKSDLGSTPKGELLTLRIRFKRPTVDVSKNMELSLVDSGGAFASASQDFKFAAAVASFGMILRESPLKGSSTYDNVIAWAEGAEGDDVSGDRREFVSLVRRAKVLAEE